MLLYDNAHAPSPRRVRIFLREKGIEARRVPVDILEGGNLRPDFLKVRPRGLLPILQLDDGSTIDETVAICRYFEELHPAPALMGSTPLGKPPLRVGRGEWSLTGWRAWPRFSEIRCRRWPIAAFPDARAIPRSRSSSIAANGP